MTSWRVSFNVCNSGEPDDRKSMASRIHTLVEARRRKEVMEEAFLGRAFETILVRANMVAVKT